MKTLYKLTIIQYKGRKMHNGRKILYVASYYFVQFGHVKSSGSAVMPMHLK